MKKSLEKVEETPASKAEKPVERCGPEGAPEVEAEAWAAVDPRTQGEIADNEPPPSDYPKGPLLISLSGGLESQKCGPLSGHPESRIDTGRPAIYQ